MAGLAALGGVLNSGMSMLGAVGGVASGKAENAANEQATSNFRNESSAINTKTLDSRTSQAKQEAELADQAAEDAINGTKVKLKEQAMKRSMDTVTSMGQIG